MSVQPPGEINGTKHGPATKAQHTPEQAWRFEFDQLMVYDDGRTPMYLTDAEYNHARACVSACAGMRNPVGEVYQLEQYVKALTARMLEAEQQRDDLQADAERYRWLRSRDLDAIDKGGVFAGLTPDNLVLSDTELDAAIDAARGKA